MQQDDTISAISTGSGAGGIGIVRLSGKDAVEVAGKIFFAKNGKCVSELKSHSVTYGEIRNEKGETIDEALLVIMRAPNSYTREDVVELQCHGGALALRETLFLTLKNGARGAQAGEFTKRAFLNGRLDLAQAQSVMEIIGAKTASSLKLATGHLAGRYSGEIKAYRDELISMLAHLEALIDFPEDEVDNVTEDELCEKICALEEKIARLIKTAHTGKILKEGLTTAIVGRPNVGKSSLLNALLKEERAIVTDVPGTTRDSIEEYAEFGGIPLRIIDTAGIREAADEVEKIGIERAKNHAQNASLILAVFDNSVPKTAEDEEIISLARGKNAFALLNKSDLPPKFAREALTSAFDEENIIEISAKSGEGLGELAKKTAAFVYGGEISEEHSFVTDVRDENLLIETKNHLSEAKRALTDGIGVDFAAIDIRAALEKLGAITGDTVGEDIIEEIFTKFCIGK